MEQEQPVQAILGQQRMWAGPGHLSKSVPSGQGTLFTSMQVAL